MGNSASSAPISNETYRAKLASVHESANSTAKKSDGLDIIELYSSDVLQILISFCERSEQCSLINLMFDNLEIHKNVIPTILNKIKTKPVIDPYLITAFNKKNAILDNIEGTMEYRFYFTNIHIKGTEENIKYLKANEKSVIYSWMYSIAHGGNELLKRDNSNAVLQIDKFVELHKNNKHKAMIFNSDDIFYFDDEKLENIKYKNAYKFDKFQRIPLNDADNLGNLSWSEYNNIFLKYLITNQLNFCCDDKKAYNKDINDNIDLETDHTLNILTGCSLYEDPVSAYTLNMQISKHSQFVGGLQYKTYSRSKKVSISTTKTSLIFLVNNNSNDINVISMVNPSSEHHIKDKKSSAGKSIKQAYVDTVCRSGF